MLMAPIIRQRKGEHLHAIEMLRGQGFVRARIDGIVVELDSAPELDAKRKHDIDVVVDRLKIREDVALRLAESLETAINLSEGMVYIGDMDNAQADDQVFSSRYACPECGYSLTELEPRLFSFNSPTGACPECDGLGVSQFFDPDHVVGHPHLSLAAGAVRGWDRRNAYYFSLIQSLAEHYDFDIETPFDELDEKFQKVVLRGSGKEVIRFRYHGSKGKSSIKTHRFEGVIPNMERRYRDTESNTVREELSKYLSSQPCQECCGSRLNEAARNVFIDDQPLHKITSLPIGTAQDFFQSLSLPGKRAEIAAPVVKEISQRLNFLVNVGLDYLSLDRSAETLSGGEAQRIRLASQIGAGLVGVMYVLDEPSIGLHQRDNQRLLNTLTYLRDLGNTVIVVEHDEEAINSADHVVDMGPGAGIHGGQVVAQGTPGQIKENPNSLTGQYLSNKVCIAIPGARVEMDPKRQLQILGASGNNLRDVDVSIPLGLLTCVTGVSGSGKSTLINDTLYHQAARDLNGAMSVEPAPCREIIGLDQFDKIINIDQSPIGRTPRSNPATYTGLFTPIRELFSGTAEARSRGYNPGRFSFNVRGGRCEACQGDGVIKVEMHFLADIYVNCDICKGNRYNRETLEIRYKGKNIHEVLDMTVEIARGFFDPVPVIARRLQTLLDVGLGYIRLGQNATTLSGGEAQRVKLSRELSKRDTGNTLYILDEPTTGLHFHDIQQLLHVLHRLRDHGNTIVVIEHNLDVIKTADWVIDLGPEGGNGGGMIVAAGTPETITKAEASYTGQFLKPLL